MGRLEDYLFGENAGIPLHEASQYFIDVRQPRLVSKTAGMNKTAGWADPPDETGSLEGALALPLEQAVNLMGQCATALIRLANAYQVYKVSVRGALAEEARRALNSCWGVEQDFGYLVERMAILAGPPHVGDPDMPPASIDAVQILRRMIRAEQELSALLNQLKEACGENPMKGRICEMLRSNQDRIDSLWKALPPEVSNVSAPPPEPVAEGAAPQEPAEETEVQKAASAMVKWASGGTGANLAFTEHGGRLYHDLGNGIQASLPIGEEADAYKRQVAAEQGWVGSTAPTTAEDSLSGRVGKALSRRLDAKNPNRPRYASLKDMLLGRPDPNYVPGPPVHKVAAKEAPTDAELKEHGRQRAVANISAEHHREAARRGERAGRALGAIGGGVGGAALGKKLIGGRSGTIAGLAAGTLAGRALGGELGTEADIARSKKASIDKVAAAMVGWVKQADEMAGGTMDREAPMASPTDMQEVAPVNYLQAEWIGQQAQNRQEADFYRRRAVVAEQQAAQVQQATQEALQQAQQQAAMAQETAASADQRVQAALGEAMQAKDDALKQTETAARMRIAQQDLRMRLMELASQDPDQAAAMNLAASTGQATPMGTPVGQVGAPDAGLNAGIPGGSGPAGAAPDQQTAPGAAPPAGSPDMNANAGGAPGPDMSSAQVTQNKVGSAKTAGPLGFGLGALVGAADQGYKLRSAYNAGVDPAKERVAQLEQAQDGSYAQAAALARAKGALANRELLMQFPGRTSAKGVLMGAGKGAALGHAIQNDISQLGALSGGKK